MARKDSRYGAPLDDCETFPPTVCDHTRRGNHLVLETIDHEPDTNIVLER